jgi:hypothetical protein
MMDRVHKLTNSDLETVDSIYEYYVCTLSNVWSMFDMLYVSEIVCLSVNRVSWKKVSYLVGTGRISMSVLVCLNSDITMGTGK